jgi:hypothetical protein
MTLRLETFPALLAGLLLIPLVPQAARAGDPLPAEESLEKAFPQRTPYSPYAGRDFPTRPFWGDTHLHTALSMDAGAFGARLTPSDAYRFAKGQELISSTGLPVRLSRPLDFLVVADHSDNMGFFPRLFAGDPAFLADPTGRRWHEMIQQGGQQGVQVAVEVIEGFSQGSFPEAMWSKPGTTAYRNAWEQMIRAAEDHYDPGHFTAFIGYEWTSNTGGNNLHRVVIHRDGGHKASMVEPYTTIAPLGSDNPATSRTASCSRASSRLRSARSTRNTRVRARAGSRSTRRPRSRATARPTHSCHRTTSSPTTRPGTRPISTSRCRRRTRCCSTSTRARRSASAWSSSGASAPTRTSSG